LKPELQTLADQTGLPITVAHLPPDTGMSNRVEHRLFAFNAYEKRIKMSGEQIGRLNITSADFHGEWNYMIAHRAPNG